MKVRVEIYANMDTLDHYEALRDYVIDYDDSAQRRVLAEQCRNAFEAGQFVLTYPVSAAPSGTNGGTNGGSAA